MRARSLLTIFISSIAWGAGDQSEARCDSPGSGVTCLCSEPFTFDEGQHGPAEDFNPAGTSGATQCNGGGNTVSRQGSSSYSRSVLASSLNNPITVGGSGYVMQFDAGATFGVWDITRDYTNGTYCTRHYAYFDDAYDCSGASPNCNIKGPRFQQTGGEDWTGPQTGTGNYWSIFGIYWDPNSTAGDSLCADASCGIDWGSQFLPQNDDGLNFDNMRGAWIRWEICFDHNLTSQQVSDMNAEYGTIVSYPGANHVYGRMRQVVLTGDRAGDEILWGPAVASKTPSSIGTGNKTWLASSYLGDPTPGLTTGALRIAYVMVAKTTADPLYWIGPALEVNAGAESIDGDADAGSIGGGADAGSVDGTAGWDSQTSKDDSGAEAAQPGGGETMGGCSCSIPLSGREPAAPLLLAVLAVGLMRRRLC